MEMLNQAGIPTYASPARANGAFVHMAKAFVVINQSVSQRIMQGVAIIAADPDGHKAEFAVLLDDSWQGKGIGANLLEQLLKIARQRGIAQLLGCVLKENVTMLHLGKKAEFAALGCTVSRRCIYGFYCLARLPHLTPEF